MFSCRCVSLAVMSGTTRLLCTYVGVHVMVQSVTLARTDILPEDGHTVTETCRRFCGILAF